MLVRVPAQKNKNYGNPLSNQAPQIRKAPQLQLRLRIHNTAYHQKKKLLPKYQYENENDFSFSPNLRIWFMKVSHPVNKFPGNTN
jgi:hypothetical protein